MDFSSSYLLFGLILIPVLIILFFIFWRDKMRRLEAFGDMSLLKKLIPENIWERQKIKMILRTVVLLFLIFAIAGPRFGTKLMNIKRHGIDVIIAVDTSLSMLAEDIAPSRMKNAKVSLSRLISRLDGNRIGIIAFAGQSFLQCPLTLDNTAVRMFLDEVSVGMIPQGGTDISSVINLALNTFPAKERKYKALVILTDGENHDSDPLKIADEAKKQGIVIYTIGYGTSEGEVIPIRDANGSLIDYKKDRDGKTVVTKLDDSLLKKIADITNGRYYHSDGSDVVVDRVAEEINGLETKELSSKVTNRLEERFYYFVAVALILLIIELFL